MAYSSPSTRGRQLKEEAQYQNADLYENMPSPKLANRYPPKPASSSSAPAASSPSASAGHYKTPVPKISSKFLAADSKNKAAAQVTNTVLCSLDLHILFLSLVLLHSGVCLGQLGHQDIPGKLHHNTFWSSSSIVGWRQLTPAKAIGFF